MQSYRSTLIAGTALVALLGSSSLALGQSLGAAASFAVVGAAGVTAAGGAGTIVTGDVGASPTPSLTGFPPAVVVPPFGLHANDAAAVAAQAADVALFTALGAGACSDSVLPQMSGVAFTPGIHCFSSSADLAALATMSLNGPGVYIFRVPSSLTANVGSTVTLNGVDPCTVFWQVGTAATLNGVNFPGNVVAQAGVTVGTGGSLTGRALATVGAVTLAGNNTVGGCSAAVPPPPGLLPPTLTKAFNPASILAGGLSTLTITLLNPNPVATTLIAPLVDTLPAGVTIAAVPTASTTCAGGTVSAAPSGSSVTLSAGAVIPAGVGPTAGSCTVSVSVTSPTPGSYLNVLATNALQTTAGNNAAPAEATLTVTPVIPDPPAVLPPTIAKQFNAAAILAGGVSRLTITLGNPNATLATLTAAFIDTLPGGVVVAPVPNAATTCAGTGAVGAVPGGSTVTLPATRAIPAGVGAIPGSCTVSVDVTAPGCGNFVNTIAPNALQTSNGNNAGQAVATLAVTCVAPPGPPVAPTLAKQFNAATILAGGVSRLTITLSNPNLTVATLTAVFTDTLPGGVIVAPVPNAATTCVGSGAVGAVPGASTVTLPTTRAIPAGVGATPGSCTVSVDVTAPVCGNFVNTIPANALQTSNGNNAGQAVATLAVTCIVPPIPPQADQPIPTLSELGKIVLVLLLAISAVVAMRRRG